MTSELLTSLGLGGIDIAYFLIGFIAMFLIVIVALIVMAIKMKNTKKRYAAFMKGKNASSLEDKMMELQEEYELLLKQQKENRNNIKNLYKKSEYAIQKTAIVRYDAYQQLGGLLSFSLALLNENNNGFILNSVHTSDSCYTYTKEIINGECSITLSNEEKIALEQAMEISSEK